MRTVLATVLLLAVSATPVFAQMNAQPGGPMNGGVRRPLAMPMMPPPPPPNVPASRLAKALEFLGASGTRDLITQYVERVTPMATMMAQRQLKPNDVAAQKDIANAVNAEMKNSVKEILDNTARVYAGHFSDAELDALTAFFKSPAGRKYTGLRQVLQQESSNVVRAWAMKTQTVTINSLVQKVAKAHPGSLAAPAALPSKPGGAPK